MPQSSETAAYFANISITEHPERSLAIGENINPLTIDHLVSLNGCLIWGSYGMFVLIHACVLKNAFQAYTAWKLRRENYPLDKTPVIAIMWEQGIPVSREAVDALLNRTADERKQLRNTYATAHPPNKDNRHHPKL